MAKLALRVNGRTQNVDADPETPLLYVLRDDLGLRGPKFGCGLGQCGACTVMIDGVAARSCSIPVSKVGARAVTTLEGLGSSKKPHPVQQAFIEEQAAQCGYCANGMMMTAAAFLSKKKNPTDADIKRALAGNLCRCGTHVRIVRAVKRAATLMA